MNTSILDTIGNTPLVAITRLNPNPNVRILAKLEYFNPGGSIKDRAALSMITAGEQEGKLTADKTVIEATSGNTGIGLALVCAVKGYRLVLAMSEAVSLERRKNLKARGAQILLTPAHLGTDGAIEEVYRLALEDPGRYFMVDQFNNPANWQAHVNGTAREIWDQTGGTITHLVATLGTSGTLMGLSRGLKAYNPTVTIVGVEPYLGHKIQGLKNMKEAYRPEIYEKNRLDEKVNIEDEEAFEMTRRLARTEGLLVGMSSGAAMAIAAKLASRLHAGTIVVIFPDGGERYLSTPVFAVADKAGPHLFNTMTRRKEAVEPVAEGKIGMYSCGPTAHAPMHLTECRRMVFADLLARYLVFRGFDVTHVMNITDLDDKTIEGAEQAGLALAEFTGRHIEAFHRDLGVLGVKPADAYPLAGQHIDEMVALARKLVKKGYAYEKMRSLYFDISRLGGYGKLSGIDLDKIRLGATVDLEDYEKNNPRDFTVLKRSTLKELKRGIFTKTEWGNVRPSWHLQCAAMSMTHLGSGFDIHTASRDLAFPHHENENAIAVAATGKPLARYWIHCEGVLVEGKKAQAAPLTLSDLLQQGCSGKQVRFLLLSSHYRKPITLSAERLEDARRSLARLNRCIHALAGLSGGAAVHPETAQLSYDIKNGFVSAMDDDLNTSAALASLFTTVRRIHCLVQDQKLGAEDARQLLEAFAKVDEVLNVLALAPLRSDERVRQLITQRDQARGRGDFATADRLRAQLVEMGIQVMDQKRQG